METENLKKIYELLNKIPETEENKITMITCIPNRREQRLCVQATEIMEKI